ncbi:MAG TPA: retron system putative HNH endonuclease [Candidatus Nanopelagicales bacterium]|nr:retron system putative HNH endonuclease [Candidatus Nanopelagicales bacterium]
MRRIRKGPEPEAWKEYRLSTPGATFDGAPKKKLREALLAEQGHLCCYCMRRIEEETTRIEHRRPREVLRQRRPGEKYDEFSYRNLLAACQGGEGLAYEDQHCDVRKHNEEITVDPTDPARDVESLIRYSASGELRSDDEQIQRDLAVTLNLNLQTLKDARLAVLDGFRAVFERKHQGEWSTDIIERELKKWTDIPRGGKLTSYAGVVVHYLRRRLQRATKR